MSSSDVVAFLRASFGNSNWPKPFHVLEGALRIQAGEEPEPVARSVRTTRDKLLDVATSPDPVAALLRVSPEDVTPEDLAKTRRILGQLLLGRAAELAFEEIYKSEMGTEDFELRDLREGRTDTDYRLLNGQKRPLYRINIKFFGSLFRRGVEMVGLEPEDCFPLATYKIFGALKKQEQEHLPYIFTIVSVPHLSIESIAELLPARDIDPLTLILKSKTVTGRRNLEDRAVDQIVAGSSPAFVSIHKRIHDAQWFVLSARKADRALRELLFDRVYALRIRGFAQQFRGAELDMHFSLKKDLMPLTQFLEILRTEGQARVSVMLERGTI